MVSLAYTCLDDLCKDCRDLLLFSFTELQLLIVLCLLVWAAFWPVMSETGFHRCQEAHLLLQGLIPGSSSEWRWAGGSLTLRCPAWCARGGQS